MRSLIVATMFVLAGCTGQDATTQDGHTLPLCTAAEQTGCCHRVDTITATFDGVTETHELVCEDS